MIEKLGADRLRALGVSNAWSGTKTTYDKTWQRLILDVRPTTYHRPPESRAHNPPAEYWAPSLLPMTPCACSDGSSQRGRM